MTRPYPPRTPAEALALITGLPVAEFVKAEAAALALAWAWWNSPYFNVMEDDDE